MKIVLRSAALSEIRAAQAGDWRIYHNGTITALAAEMGDERAEFAVAVHEAVEALLCRSAGISDETVTKFDLAYEQERAQGKHGPHEENGDDERAPYYEQHQRATDVERAVCDALGLSWDEHTELVNALFR